MTSYEGHQCLNAQRKAWRVAEELVMLRGWLRGMAKVIWT